MADIATSGLGVTPNDPLLEDGAAPQVWGAAGLSAAQMLAQSYFANQFAGMQNERIDALTAATLEAATRDRQRIDSNVNVLQREANIKGRIAVANAERQVRQERAAAHISAAERGVSGGSVRDLEDALTLEETQKQEIIRRDVKNMKLQAVTQAEQQKSQVRDRVLQAEMQPKAQEVEPWMMLLQAGVAGTQAGVQQQYAYNAGARS